MPRLHFHAKLLLAFGAVLLPVLVVLCADFLSGLQRTQETLLDAQSMTAQAVAVQISDSFDSAIRREVAIVRRWTAAVPSFCIRLLST